MKPYAPTDSTQLDSVAQADTLATFGVNATPTKKPSELKLTDYGFFAGSKYFHPELGLDRNGVAGDPAPYNVANDNVITGLLLVFFIVATVLISSTRDFIVRQTRSFFHSTRRTANIGETTAEVNLQLVLVLQTALMGGILYYMYAREVMGMSFSIDSPLAVIGIFCAVFFGYFLLKAVLYSIVNWVFFGKQSRQQWWKTWLYLTALEGVALFPLVLLLVYLDISPQAWLVTLLIVAITIKILTFYKAFCIFFRQTRLYLQFFLYLCALELMPMASLAGLMSMLSSRLQI